MISNETDAKADPGAPSRRGRRIALWSGLGVVGVAAAGYVALAASQSGHIASGTTVNGVYVGGMSPSEAQAAIAKSANAKLAQPISINAAGKVLTVHPKSAGLSFPANDALATTTDFSLNPATVWDRLQGGQDVTVPPTVNKDALRQAVAEAGSVLKGSPTNGKVSFNDGKVDVVRSVDGTGLDYAGTADEIAANWPAKTSYDSQVSTRAPELTNDEIDQFVTTFASKAVSGPVKVVAADKSVQLTPSMISGVLSAPLVNGQLTPKIDPAALNTLMQKMAVGLVTPPVNAKVAVQNGTKVVVPAKDGTEVDTSAMAPQLLTALTSADRTVQLATKPAKAQVTDIDLATTGNELMSEFVSNFPTGSYNAARTHNIQTALAKLNGMYVAPGEQFSLLQALTPIDAAHGYVNAPVLVGGADELGMGGGISQVSTTLYNATFFAGLQLDEHTAHNYWISRYPMGREATLWVPYIDNKWTNDSGHGILIEAGIEGHAAVIRLYGTKAFTVTSNTGQPFNVVAPKTQTVSKKGCIAQPPVQGFDVTVTRVVKDLSGKVVKNESLTTHYIPADRIVCTGN